MKTQKKIVEKVANATEKPNERATPAEVNHIWLIQDRGLCRAWTWRVSQHQQQILAQDGSFGSTFQVVGAH